MGFQIYDKNGIHKNHPYPWYWVEGNVDKSMPHFVLKYGKLFKVEIKDLIIVAVVSRPVYKRFTVEFLFSGDTKTEKEMVDQAEREINFYLLELGERNPYLYLRYHCGTASNWYSHIHWVYRSGE
jgi:hypothetical protein